MKSKIGIVGCGCVGGALLHLFETNGYKVVKYDKFKKFGTKEEINECDIVFICVPTPFKGNRVDISAVEECVKWVKSQGIVIKSTVPVGTCDKLAKKYHLNSIIHNPEFLRADTANIDIFTEGRVLIGYTTVPSLLAAYRLHDLYKKILPFNPEIKVLTVKQTEMIKYATNAFLSTKVAFCNEMDLIARKFGMTWNNDLRKPFLLDKRVGDSHTLISEERGFGGACLPKDLDGLISFSNSKFFKEVKEQNERTKSYKVPQAKHAKEYRR